ncbi:MAG TPA: MarC family protein [Terriglobales bacterium]|nr:MarC family protein [Terriglobales bacterium]
MVAAERHEVRLPGRVESFQSPGHKASLRLRTAPLKPKDGLSGPPAGPGSIGVVMGLSASADSMVAYLGMVIGIAALGLVVYLFLCLGGPLVKRLGPGAAGAINRIFGFLLLAIAVQLVWNGVADFKA